LVAGLFRASGEISGGAIQAIGHPSQGPSDNAENDGEESRSVMRRPMPEGAELSCSWPMGLGYCLGGYSPDRYPAYAPKKAIPIRAKTNDPNPLRRRVPWLPARRRAKKPQAFDAAPPSRPTCVQRGRPRQNHKPLRSLGSLLALGRHRLRGLSTQRLTFGAVLRPNRLQESLRWRSAGCSQCRPAMASSNAMSITSLSSLIDHHPRAAARRSRRHPPAAGSDRPSAA
jgi:hypothetical protein